MQVLFLAENSRVLSLVAFKLCAVKAFDEVALSFPAPSL